MEREAGHLGICDNHGLEFVSSLGSARLEDLFADSLRPEALRDRVDPIERHELPALERGVERARPDGLGRDHLGGPPGLVHPLEDAHQEATTAHTGHHRIGHHTRRQLTLGLLDDGSVALPCFFALRQQEMLAE